MYMYIYTFFSALDVLMTTSLNDKITEVHVLKGFIQYTCTCTNVRVSDSDTQT